MARVTPETVAKVAGLARLSLTEEEALLFSRQLEQILTWAESLSAVDVAGVEPLASPPVSADLRDDVPRPGLDRERVLSAAPDATEGLFRVPRVISR
jgi:aspartyl-tRNA(Asn)/glutamyl-tRNA(Gln) amidotransferase subunit C